MKKIISLALALVMILSLAVFTFAAAPALPEAEDEGTITITNAQSGIDYTIYKLFDAEVGEKKTGDTEAPISYYIDKGDFATLYADIAAAKMQIEVEDPETHVKSNKDVNLFKLKATADPDVFQVEKGAEATEAGILDWVKNNYSNYELPYQTKTATADELEFADIPFGYYVIAADGSQASQVSVNSTKPEVEVAIKIPTTPSNPQKVQDKDQVSIGDTITYNASVKAVNTYVGTGNPPKIEKVKRYSFIDTPDEDQAGLSIPTIKVYAAADLDDAECIDENGDIICGDNGLYAIPDSVDFDTVSKSDYANSWQTADGTGATPVDGWYFLPADKDTPADMVYTVEGTSIKYDMRYVAVPWQNADGDFLYDANSYIVLTYTQTVGAGLDSIDRSAQSELYDGVYTNKIQWGFLHADTSEPIGDEQIVKAYSTAISLRKLYDGSDDTKTLDGAEFKFQNNTADDENYGKWYKDNAAEIAAANAQNAERAAILAQNAQNAIDRQWNLDNPGETPREVPEDKVAPAEATVPELEVEWVSTEAAASILIADNSYTTIEIHSLNSGDYILKEVKAPEGYTIPDYQWNVKIEFEKDLGTKATDTSFAHYTVSVKQTNQSAFGTALGNNGHDFYTVQIVNTKGTALPSTGGAGTVALVAIGTLLFLATGVVLVTKKRLYNEG